MEVGTWRWGEAWKVYDLGLGGQGARGAGPGVVLLVGGGFWLGLAMGTESPPCAIPRQLQIQDLAIRCVQKNIKKNKGVKDWPWWKLFTTVRPLIEVQLSEEQIRNKDVRNLPG
jgi:hypothetical protein